MLQRISPRICFDQKLIEFYLSLFLQIHHQNDPNRPRFVAVTTLEDVQAVRCAEFHPNGRVYSVGSNSKTFRICEYPSLSEIRYIHFNGSLRKDRTGRLFLIHIRTEMIHKIEKREPIHSRFVCVKTIIAHSTSEHSVSAVCEVRERDLTQFLFKC